MSAPVPHPKMSISGDIGSGKSAVGRLLHKLTGFPIYSTGALQRKIAERHGMSTLELNRYAETHPEIDDEIDSESIRLGKTDEAFIIDSRIAWHFIPHSFKVYLAVDLDVAARRILGDSERTRESYGDLETAKREILKRRRSEVERFRSVYGIDLSDLDNYDLVVDTSETSQEEIAKAVLGEFRKWASGGSNGDRKSSSSGSR